jgi:hypothetical protein
VTSFQIHKPGLEEFGTAGQYEVETLEADLMADGIGFDSDDLAEALQLLEDCAVPEISHRIVWRTVYRRVTQRARVMTLTPRRPINTVVASASAASSAGQEMTPPQQQSRPRRSPRRRPRRPNRHLPPAMLR